jgi:hypothetical protein
MAGRDGRITATDPRDGAPVVVSVRGGQWRWTPAPAVVVVGNIRDCGRDCGSTWEVTNVMPQGAPPGDAAIDLDELLGTVDCDRRALG